MEVKKFSELGISASNTGMTGDKIKIAKVMNREITILDYKVADSLHSGKCLHLQIILNDTKHVIFTGSKVLLNMMQQVNKEDLPVVATIEKIGEHFEFV